MYNVSETLYEYVQKLLSKPNFEMYVKCKYNKFIEFDETAH